MTYKRYENYKDSEIEWIGEIPDSWDIVDIKYLISEDKYSVKSGPFGSQLKNDDMLSGKYKVYNQRNVLDNDFYSGEYYINEEKYEELKAFKISSSDILVTTRGTIGKVAIVPEIFEEGILHPCLIKIRFNHKKVLNEFIEKIFNNTQIALNQVKLLSNATTIDVIYTDTIKNLRIVIPSINEQKQILDFIDKNTTKIDTLIKEKEELIKLLKEQRQSIITEAVVKGIDKSINMKYSGIEWIGDIPEHWSVKRIKHVISTQITDGPHETPKLLEDGIPFISAEAIKNNKINFNLKRGYISEELSREYSKKCRPKINDILMVKSGATTGALAMVETEEKFNIWSPLALIRVNEEYYRSKYIFYSMLSDIFKIQVENGWNYGTQQNIGMKVIENLFIVIPNLQEQYEIIEFLDQKTSEIDEVIRDVEEGINNLREYRQSLISEAVTGKIDIRNID